MATLTDCPTCGRKLQVPDDLVGSAVRCPDCGGTFDAQAGPPPALVPAAAPPADALRRGGVTPPPARADDETRACPACGERIPATAARCPACRVDLGEEDDRPWERRRRHLGRMDSEPHRGTAVLVLGILGLVLGLMMMGFVGLPLAIIAWVMGHKDLKKIRAGAMDPEGEGLTQAGRILGIIGTIWDSLVTLGCIGYFVLIFAFMGVAMRMTPPPPPAPPTATPMPAPPVQKQAAPDVDRPAPPKAKQAPSSVKSPDQGTGRRPEGSTKK